MITLAVTAGIMVYVYSSGLLGSLSGSKVQQPYVEHISLDYYAWNLVQKSVNLTLRNTGSSQVILADFFIAGNTISNVTWGSSSGCSITHVVNVNSLPCSVTLLYSGTQFKQGISYNVRVVSNDGAVFDFACIAGTTS